MRSIVVRKKNVPSQSFFSKCIIVTEAAGSVVGIGTYLSIFGLNPFELPSPHPEQTGLARVLLLGTFFLYYFVSFTYFLER